MAILWPVAHLPAIAQSAAKRAVITPAITEISVRKSVFAGNEAQISAMHWVKMDCTSGQLPDVRIVTSPSKGEIRLEPVQHAVARQKDNDRAHCNGKLVDAVGVFYKANQDIGSDRVVLDVDFKTGVVHRYSISINVR
jgi:hypothetical protein